MQYVMTPYTSKIEQFAWWDGAFTSEELDLLQAKAKGAQNQAKAGGAVNEEVRRSNVDWLHNSAETTWAFKKFSDVAAKLNAQNFRFDLTGFGEPLQLTHYDQSEHGMYGWHQDFGGEGASRKLSIVMQLSDPSEYEGGNLQIMSSGTPVNIPKKRGYIVVFPSYAVHQVTPVTQGTRQSLVAWVSGPQFK